MGGLAPGATGLEVPTFIKCGFVYVCVHMCVSGCVYAEKKLTEKCLYMYSGWIEKRRKAMRM